MGGARERISGRGKVMVDVHLASSPGPKRGRSLGTRLMCIILTYPESNSPGVSVSTTSSLVC